MRSWRRTRLVIALAVVVFGACRGGSAGGDPQDGGGADAIRVVLDAQRSDSVATDVPNQPGGPDAADAAVMGDAAVPVDTPGGSPADTTGGRDVAGRDVVAADAPTVEIVVEPPRTQLAGPFEIPGASREWYVHYDALAVHPVERRLAVAYKFEEGVDGDTGRLGLWSGDEAFRWTLEWVSDAPMWSEGCDFYPS